MNYWMFKFFSYRDKVENLVACADKEDDSPVQARIGETIIRTFSLLKFCHIYSFWPGPMILYNFWSVKI